VRATPRTAGIWSRAGRFAFVRGAADRFTDLLDVTVDGSGLARATLGVAQMLNVPPFTRSAPFDTLCRSSGRHRLISDGEINGGLAHEDNESVTDPLPNDAWTNGAGADQGE
jgi:hypothetical protein